MQIKRRRLVSDLGADRSGQVRDCISDCAPSYGAGQVTVSIGLKKRSLGAIPRWVKVCSARWEHSCRIQKLAADADGAASRLMFP